MPSRTRARARPSPVDPGTAAQPLCEPAHDDTGRRTRQQRSGKIFLQGGGSGVHLPEVVFPLLLLNAQLPIVFFRACGPVIVVHTHLVRKPALNVH